jgi:DNA replication protein DnaC
MEITDLLQIQLLQQLKDMQNGSLFYMIFTPVLITFITMAINIAKNLAPRLVDMLKKYYTEKANDVMSVVEKNSILDSVINLGDKHILTEILFTRVYSSDEAMNEVCDSILNAVSQLQNIPMLKLIHNGDYIISYKDKPIQITSELYFKIHQITYNPEQPHKLDLIKFSLYGDQISTLYINKWTSQVYHEYKQSLQNEFSSSLYYFEYNSNEKLLTFDPRGDLPTKSIDKRIEIMNAPKHLTFTKNEFVSNKNFDSLYGKNFERIYKHVKFFTENENWYKEQGLPYHLGILFHGKPGCGKTACIKAISNYTNRHIININFRYIKTMTQFKNLFNDNNLTITIDESRSNNRKIFIPQKNRLYVFEEIDAISDIVKQRTNNTVVKDNEIEDELTLGGILQLIDGTLEVPSRMMIITSNHPEIIDKALLRPGRIDLNIEFGNCDKKCIRDMYYAFFKKEPKDDMLKLDITPAEFQRMLLESFSI